MLLDEVLITVETKEATIFVQDMSDVQLSVKPVADIEVTVSNELDIENVVVEVAEAQIKLEKLEDIDISVRQAPEVIVLIAANIGAEGDTGPPGPPGSPGPAGPPGPTGTGFIFTQSSPSATWTIIHNLNRWPSVTVVDSGNSEIIPNVVYTNSNQVMATFGSPTSGKAYLN
jgi:hypothetical protein